MYINTSVGNKHELSQVDGNTSIFEPQPKEETVLQHSTESNKTEEEIVNPKLQDNGFARLEVNADETPPLRVFHPKLGFGTNPRYSTFKDKNCVEYTFKKGKFSIEVFPSK